MKQLMGWGLVSIGLGVILIGIRYLTYSPPDSSSSQARVGAPRITRHSGTSSSTMVAPSTSPPQSPGSIRVAAFGPTFVTLHWTMSQNAMEYVLYRSTVRDFAKAKRIARRPGTTYNDTGLRQGTTYYYWVAAQNDMGTSQPITYARVTTYDSWSTIENQYADSVVKIKTYTSALGELGGSIYGTGWISPGGYIVTNWHVIRDWNWVIDVYDQAGDKYHAKIVVEDESHDLALLQFVGPAPDLPPLPIGGSVEQGDPIAIYGHPGGEALTLTTGHVTATGITETVTDLNLTLSDMVQTNAGSVKGNSGSPVFNQWGKVVGIEESGDTTNGNVNYFVPVKYLQQWGIY